MQITTRNPCLVYTYLRNWRKKNLASNQLQSPTYLLIRLFLFPHDNFTKVKFNVDSAGVHPQLSHNQCHVVGSHWPHKFKSHIQKHHCKVLYQTGFLKRTISCVEDVFEQILKIVHRGIQVIHPKLISKRFLDFLNFEVPTKFLTRSHNVPSSSLNFPTGFPSVPNMFTRILLQRYDVYCVIHFNQLRGVHNLFFLLQ